MRLLRAIFAWLVLRLIGRRREHAEEEALAHRIVAPKTDKARGAETLMIWLLFAAAACAVLFVVFYAMEASTQALGLTLGGALLLAGIALVVMSKRVLVTEELESEYHEPDVEEADKVTQIVQEGGDGITRKGLLLTAGGVAGGAIVVAAVTPAASLGPLIHTEPLHRTPWRRGVRLVDEHNVPLKADDIEEATFYTGFPEGAFKNDIATAVVIVRLPPPVIHLPPGRRGWAPGGILAYSKSCTHAGCAISLYRYPLFEPTQPAPALVCPCHYSTFNPATGATVEFGPAGRPLPQLPLMIDSAGFLRAGGNLSASPGPGWAGALRRPT
jgi:ubiquinol-cytochrome c reductase iron-sulfur subunit